MITTTLATTITTIVVIITVTVMDMSMLRAIWACMALVRDGVDDLKLKDFSSQLMDIDFAAAYSFFWCIALLLLYETLG